MVENTDIDPAGLRELLKTYFSNVENAWPSGHAGDWAHRFLDRFRTDLLEDVCRLGAEKLAESLTDGKHHTTEISQSDTFVSVSTFPCGLDEARRNYYANGYFEHLNSMLRISRNNYPACHYIHIQFFCDHINCWVQFTLFPNKEKLGFDPLYNLPVDLLTIEERQQVGLA